MLELDADFLKRCDFYHRAAQRAWGRRFLARKPERRLAGGTEVTGYSDYTSGNDLRYVDWNRCARHDELVVKQFQGNEDQYTYFLVDCSASMRREDGRKFDAARRLTAALAYLSLANLDCVGLAAFGDGLIAEHRPVRGKQHFPSLLRFLSELPEDATRATNLRKATRAFAQRTQRSGLAIVVSDMFDFRFEAAIDSLRRRDYEPYVLQVIDEFDEDPQVLGGVRLTDVETGRTHRRSIDEADLANYRQVFEEYRQRLRRYCFRYNVGLSQVRAETPVSTSLERIVQAARR